MELYLKKLITIKKTPIENKIIQNAFSTQLSVQLRYGAGGHIKSAARRETPTKASSKFIALDFH